MNALRETWNNAGDIYGARGGIALVAIGALVILISAVVGLALLAGAPVQEQPPAFEDLTGVPGAALIEEMHREGFVAGCSTEPPAFCPDREITRAEIAVLLVRAERGSDFEPAAAPDADHWGDPWLAEAERLGLMQPVPDGHQDDPATRADVVILLALARD